MAERIKAMQEIWANDEAEFHGTFVDFDPIWQWPKPVQQPHPPILVGGGGAKVIDRVLDYGTTPVTHNARMSDLVVGICLMVLATVSYGLREAAARAARRHTG